MFTSSHNRWQNFFIGLLVGVIAGGAVVWFEMKDANRNFLSQILYDLNTLKLEKKIKEDEIEKVKQSQIKKQKKGSINSQKQKKESENAPDTVDSLLPKINDSLSFAIQNSDSGFTDRMAVNAVPANISEDANIVVKKDRMFFLKSMKPNVKDEIVAASNKDSLVSEISGMRKKEDEKTEFSVEFWESPINYKGYKMANKKIVLFGIDDFESAELFLMNQTIYLKVDDAVYRLDETYIFEPYKIITDKSLLAKLER